MTEKQQRILDFVRAHYARTGRGPTFKAIGAAIGTSSKGNISRQLKALVGYGYLQEISDWSGKYIPAEADSVDLSRASSATLQAELERRAAAAKELG